MTESLISLGRHFWEHLRAREDQPVVLHGKVGVPETITASRLVALTTRLAIALRRHDMEPGQRVLIATDASLEGLVTILATWMLGAVTVHIPPDLPEELTRTALARAKASWMLVKSPRALGGIELLAGDEVSAANIILVENPPVAPVAGVLSYDDLIAEGLKHRTLGLDPLARAIFAVPPDARAAIAYWQQDDELAAAAYQHAELAASLAGFPIRWNVGADAPVFITLPPGSRSGLMAVLRVLESGRPLAFQGEVGSLSASVGICHPQLLVTDADTLEDLLASLDRAESRGTVRGALRRGLGWLDLDEGAPEQEVPKTTKDVALAAVVDGLEGWAERGLAVAVRRRLGGVLRTVWCPDGVPKGNAPALLDAADVMLTDVGETK